MNLMKEDTNMIGLPAYPDATEIELPEKFEGGNTWQ
jgi:hypothetical protein